MSRASMDTSSKGNIPPEEDAGEICPVCKGAGFVHPTLDSGKVDYSRVVPCQCSKGELRKKKTEYLEKYSNMGSLSQLNFDNLTPKGKIRRHSKRSEEPHERFAQVYQAAKDFADNPQGWLLFSGPSGSGKTHLACAVANTVELHLLTRFVHGLGRRARAAVAFRPETLPRACPGAWAGRARRPDLRPRQRT